MIARAVALFVSFTLAAAVIARASKSEVPLKRLPLEALPMNLGEWQGRQAPPFDEKTLALLGADDYLTRTYVGTRSVIGLYVGYWGSQRQGDTIHSPLNCLPGSGWEPISRDLLKVQLPGALEAAPPREISINRYVVQKGLNRALVLYWYQSHGRVVANEYLSRTYLVADAVRLHRTDAALVRVTIPYPVDERTEIQAERAGVQFVTSLFPALEGYLPL